MIRCDYPADIDPRGRYSVTEAARMLGVHRETLRRYRLLGLLPQVRRGLGPGRVRYTGRELIRCWERVTCLK